jgi:hypothetical protein
MEAAPIDFAPPNPRKCHCCLETFTSPPSCMGNIFTVHKHDPNNYRIPKLLGCLHVVCSSCLLDRVNIVDSNEHEVSVAIDCPRCEDTTLLRVKKKPRTKDIHNYEIVNKLRTIDAENFDLTTMLMVSATNCQEVKGTYEQELNEKLTMVTEQQQLNLSYLDVIESTVDSQHRAVEEWYQKASETLENLHKEMLKDIFLLEDYVDPMKEDVDKLETLRYKIQTTELAIDELYSIIPQKITDEALRNQITACFSDIDESIRNTVESSRGLEHDIKSLELPWLRLVDASEIMSYLYMSDPNTSALNITQSNSMMKETGDYDASLPMSPTKRAPSRMEIYSHLVFAATEITVASAYLFTRSMFLKSMLILLFAIIGLGDDFFRRYASDYNKAIKIYRHYLDILFIDWMKASVDLVLSSLMPAISEMVLKFVVFIVMSETPYEESQSPGRSSPSKRRQMKMKMLEELNSIDDSAAAKAPVPTISLPQASPNVEWMIRPPSPKRNPATPSSTRSNRGSFFQENYTPFPARERSLSRQASLDESAALDQPSMASLHESRSESKQYNRSFNEFGHYVGGGSNQRSILMSPKSSSYQIEIEHQLNDSLVSNIGFESMSSAAIETSFYPHDSDDISDVTNESFTPNKNDSIIRSLVYGIMNLLGSKPADSSASSAENSPREIEVDRQSRVPKLALAMKQSNDDNYGRVTSPTVSSASSTPSAALTYYQRWLRKQLTPPNATKASATARDAWKSPKLSARRLSIDVERSNSSETINFTNLSIPRSVPPTPSSVRHIYPVEEDELTYSEDNEDDAGVVLDALSDSQRTVADQSMYNHLVEDVVEAMEASIVTYTSITAESIIIEEAARKEDEEEEEVHVDQDMNGVDHFNATFDSPDEEESHVELDQVYASNEEEDKEESHQYYDRVEVISQIASSNEESATNSAVPEMTNANQSPAALSKRPISPERASYLSALHQQTNITRSPTRSFIPYTAPPPPQPQALAIEAEEPLTLTIEDDVNSINSMTYSITNSTSDASTTNSSRSTKQGHRMESKVSPARSSPDQRRPSTPSSDTFPSPSKDAPTLSIYDSLYYDEEKKYPRYSPATMKYLIKREEEKVYGRTITNFDGHTSDSSVDTIHIPFNRTNLNRHGRVFNRSNRSVYDSSNDSDMDGDNDIDSDIADDRSYSRVKPGLISRSVSQNNSPTKPSHYVRPPSSTGSIDRAGNNFSPLKKSHSSSSLRSSPVKLPIQLR